MTTCKTHPTYKGIRPPTSGCGKCAAVYIKKQQTGVKACVSVRSLRALQLQIDKVRKATNVRIESMEHDETVKRLTSHVGKYYEHDYGCSMRHFLFVLGVDDLGQRNRVLEVGAIYGDTKQDPWLSLKLHDSIYQMEELKPATKEQFDEVMQRVKAAINRCV